MNSNNNDNPKKNRKDRANEKIVGLGVEVIKNKMWKGRNDYKSEYVKSGYEEELEAPEEYEELLLSDYDLMLPQVVSNDSYVESDNCFTCLLISIGRRENIDFMVSSVMYNFINVFNASKGGDIKYCFFCLQRGESYQCSCDTFGLRKQIFSEENPVVIYQWGDDLLNPFDRCTHPGKSNLFKGIMHDKNLSRGFLRNVYRRNGFDYFLDRFFDSKYTEDGFKCLSDIIINSREHDGYDLISELIEGIGASSYHTEAKLSRLENIISLCKEEQVRRKYYLKLFSIFLKMENRMVGDVRFIKSLFSQLDKLLGKDNVASFFLELINMVYNKNPEHIDSISEELSEIYKSFIEKEGKSLRRCETKCTLENLVTKTRNLDLIIKIMKLCEVDVLKMAENTFNRDLLPDIIKEDDEILNKYFFKFVEAIYPGLINHQFEDQLNFNLTFCILLKIWTLKGNKKALDDWSKLLYSMVEDFSLDEYDDSLSEKEKVVKGREELTSWFINRIDGDYEFMNSAIKVLHILEQNNSPDIDNALPENYEENIPKLFDMMYSGIKGLFVNNDIFLQECINRIGLRELENSCKFLIDVISEICKNGDGDKFKFFWFSKKLCKNIPKLSGKRRQLFSKVVVIPCCFHVYKNMFEKNEFKDHFERLYYIEFTSEVCNLCSYFVAKEDDISANLLEDKIAILKDRISNFIKEGLITLDDYDFINSKDFMDPETIRRYSGRYEEGRAKQEKVASFLEFYSISYEESGMRSMTLTEIEKNAYENRLCDLVKNVYNSIDKYRTRFCKHVFTQYYENADEDNIDELKESLKQSLKKCETWLGNVREQEMSIGDFRNMEDIVVQEEANLILPDSFGSVELTRLNLKKREALNNFKSLLNSYNGTGVSNDLLRELDRLCKTTTIKEMGDCIGRVEGITHLSTQNREIYDVLACFYNPDKIHNLLKRIRDENSNVNRIATSLTMSGKVEVASYYNSLYKLEKHLREFFNKTVDRGFDLRNVFEYLRRLYDNALKANALDDLVNGTKFVEDMENEFKRLKKGINEQNMDKIRSIVKEEPNKTSEANIMFDGDFNVVVRYGGEVTEFARFEIDELNISSNLMTTQGEDMEYAKSFKTTSRSLTELSELVSTSFKEGFVYFCRRQLCSNTRIALNVAFGNISECLEILKNKVADWNRIISDSMPYSKKETGMGNRFRSIPDSLIYYIMFLASGESGAKLTRFKTNIENFLTCLGISYDDFIGRLRTFCENNDIKNLISKDNVDLRDMDIGNYRNVIKEIVQQFEPSDNFLDICRNPIEVTLPNNISTDVGSPLAKLLNSLEKSGNIKYVKVEMDCFVQVLNFLASFNGGFPKFYEILYCNKNTMKHDIDVFIHCCEEINVKGDNSRQTRFIINPNSLKADSFKYLEKFIERQQKSGNIPFIVVQLADSSEEMSERDFANVIPNDCRIEYNKDVLKKALAEQKDENYIANEAQVEIVRSLYAGEGKTTYIRRKAASDPNNLEYKVLNIMDADNDEFLVEQLQTICSDKSKKYHLHVVLNLSFGKVKKFLPFLYQLIFLGFVYFNGVIFNTNRIKAISIECREYSYNLPEIIKLNTTCVKYEIDEIDTNVPEIQNFVRNYYVTHLNNNNFSRDNVVGAFKNLFMSIEAGFGDIEARNAEARERAEEFMKNLKSFYLLRMYVDIMNSNKLIVDGFTRFLSCRGGFIVSKSFPRFFFKSIQDMASINNGLPTMRELSNIMSFDEMMRRSAEDTKKMSAPRAVIWVNSSNYVCPPLGEKINEDNIDVVIRHTLAKYVPFSKIDVGRTISEEKDSKKLSKYLFKEICWTMGAQDRYFTETEEGDQFDSMRMDQQAGENYVIRFKEWDRNGNIKYYVLNDEGNRLLSKYVFTIDNTIKMLFIYLKMINKQPVILIGETGVGKTELLNKIQEISGLSIKVLQIHSETSVEEIKDIVFGRNNDPSNSNNDDNHRGYRYIFFDEANTSPHIQKIEQLVISRTLEGRKVPEDISFIVAVNPYRRLKDEEQNLYSEFKNPRYRDRILAYTVRPLPLSLQSLAFNFGDLNNSTYVEYAKCILANVKELSANNKVNGLRFAVNIIKATKEYMEKNKFIISLRELDRYKTLIEYFLERNRLLKLNRLEVVTKGEISEVEVICLLSAYIVFSLRFPTRVRKEYNGYVDMKMELKEGCTMEKIFCAIRDKLLERVKPPEKIAMNESLKENLFSMIIAVLTKIPLIIIGKPGTSKSLGMNILERLADQGEESGLGDLLPPISNYHYQGSKNSTSRSIISAHDKAAARASLNDRCIDNGSGVPVFEHVTVFQFDEIGLAEQGGKKNALKCLHYILEIKDKNKLYEERDDGRYSKKPAFIGISNYALDQAKINRCLIFCKSDLSREDLKATANGIMKGYNTMRRARSNISHLDEIVSGYLSCLEEQKKRGLDIIGLRNFYTLITDIAERRAKAINSPDLKRLIYKSFDIYTSPKISYNPYQCFQKSFAGLKNNKLENMPPLSEFYENKLIKDNLASETGRHLMLLVDDISTVHRIIENIRKDKNAGENGGRGITSTVIMPTKKENFVTSSIQKIIGLMDPDYEKEHGQQIVFMMKCDEIYPSLFSLLNRSYSKFGNKSTVNIALDGSTNYILYVSDMFRIVTIMFQDDINEVDPAFINRFELRNMTTKKEIDEIEIDKAKKKHYSTFFEKCRKFLDELVKRYNEMGIGEDIKIEDLSWFFRDFSINNVVLYNLIKKHTKVRNGALSAPIRKLKNELSMLINPRIRAKLMMNAKVTEEAVDVNIISLESALKYIHENENSDEITPITILFVDVYKNADEIREMYGDNGFDVYDKVLAEDGSENGERTLLNVDVNSINTIKVYVPDYTKSIDTYINLASIQFYKKFGRKLKLVIIAKVDNPVISNLYVSPSSIMSYWNVSTDDLNNPFLISVMDGNGKIKIGKEHIKYLLYKTLERVYGPLRHMEKKANRQGFLKIIEGERIDFSKLFLRRIKNNEEIRSLKSELTVSSNRKSTVFGKLAKIYESETLEMLYSILKHIKDNEILIPSSDDNCEFDVITDFLDNKKIIKQLEEIPSNGETNFTHPFLYNKFSTIIRNAEYRYDESVFERNEEIFKEEYVKRLYVSYVIDKYIKVASSESIVSNLLSKYDPDNISNRAYENMFLIIRKLFGFEGKYSLSKMIHDLEDNETYNLNDGDFEALKNILNILFDTGKIEIDLKEWVQGTGKDMMRNLLSILLSGGEIEVPEKWVLNILLSSDLDYGSSGLIQYSMATMLPPNDPHRKEFIKARSLKDVWNVIAGVGDNFSKFAKRFLLYLGRDTYDEEKSQSKFRLLKRIMKTLLKLSLQESNDNSIPIDLMVLMKECLLISNNIGLLKDLVSRIGETIINVEVQDMQQELTSFVLLSVYDIHMETFDFGDMKSFMEMVENLLSKPINDSENGETFTEMIFKALKLGKILASFKFNERNNNNSLQELEEIIDNIKNNILEDTTSWKFEFFAIILKYVFYDDTVERNFLKLQFWIRDHIKGVNNIVVKNVRQLQLGALNINPFNFSNTRDFDALVSYTGKNCTFGAIDENALMILSCKRMCCAIEGFLSDDVRNEYMEDIKTHLGNNGSRDINAIDRLYFPALDSASSLRPEEYSDIYSRIFINICNILVRKYHGAGNNLLLNMILEEEDNTVNRYFIPYPAPSPDEVMLEGMSDCLRGVIICDDEQSHCKKLVTTVDSNCGDPNPDKPYEVECPLCHKRNMIRYHNAGEFVIYSNFRGNLKVGVEIVRDKSRYTKGIDTENNDVETSETSINRYCKDSSIVYITIAVISALRCIYYHNGEKWNCLVRRLINCFRAISRKYNLSVEYGFIACLNYCKKIIDVLAKVKPPTTREEKDAIETRISDLFTSTTKEDITTPFINGQESSELSKECKILKNKIKSPRRDFIQSTILSLRPIDYRMMFARNGWLYNYFNNYEDGDRLKFIKILIDKYLNDPTIAYMKTYIIAVKKIIEFVDTYKGDKKQLFEMNLGQFVRMLNGTSKHYNWFKERGNKNKILYFFIKLASIREISVGARDGNCGFNINIPKYTSFESIPFCSMYPSVLSTRIGGDDVVSGYHFIMYCIELHNRIIEEFNDCVTSFSTFNNYNKIEKQVSFKEWYGNQVVNIDMKEAIDMYIVRNYNSQTNVGFNIDLSGLEQYLYETCIRSSVIVDKDSLVGVEEFGLVDFVHSFNELGTVYSSELEKPSSIKRSIDRLENDDEKVFLLELCTKIIFKISESDIEGIREDTNVLRYIGNDEETLSHSDVLRILRSITVGQMFLFYELVEDYVGELYINKYTDPIFQQDYPWNFRILYEDCKKECENKGSFGRYVDEAEHLINLVHRILIRVCIPYNRFSFKRQEMLSCCMDEIDRVKFSIYVWSEPVDYRYSDIFIEENGGSQKILEYIEDIRDGKPIATIYNMLSMSKKLEIFLKKR